MLEKEFQQNQNHFADYFCKHFLCPPPLVWGGGGGVHIAPKPVGGDILFLGLVAICVSSEPVDVFWPNLLRYIFGRVKSCLDFGDLDFIFKVTPALWNVQKRVSGRYLLNWTMDFSQTLYIVWLWHHKELIRFWWPWSNFQGHTTTLKCQIYTKIGFPYINYLFNREIDSDGTLYIVLLWHNKDLIRFCWPWSLWRNNELVRIWVIT